MDLGNFHHVQLLLDRQRDVIEEYIALVDVGINMRRQAAEDRIARAEEVIASRPNAFGF